jgi:endonuclease/exonuclease/phosphatase family metal-dependent hydrolase
MLTLDRATSTPRRAFARAALTLALTTCATTPGPAARNEIPAPIRFLVYNIHAGKDAHGVDNLAGVASLVREVGADVVLLQEVDRRTRRSGGVDQPAVLAGGTGFHVAFGKTLDYDGGEYGIAVLSRWPIAAETLIHLPVNPPQQRAGGSMEPRGALRVAIATAKGPLTVFNTHLDPTGDDHWRRQEADSVRALVMWARSHGAPMVVAGGDFNSTPESEVQRSLRAGGLRDAWAECGKGEGLTYPADSSVKRIDYLFLTGTLTCSEARVISTQVSDHRPVLFSVRY